LTEPRDWSIAALKEHFEALRAADAAAISAALMAAEKAVNVAEINAERWRNSANEWRAAMDDRERRFAQRDAVDAADRNLQNQISELKVWRDQSGGAKMTTDRATTIALSVVAILVSLGAVIGILVHG
jgi:hypothetical protein